MRDFLLNVDRRAIFVLIFTGVVVSLLTEFEFPIKATGTVRAVYDTIERLSQKDGATVLVSFDYGPGAQPELQPMARAIVQHCLRRGVRVIGMTHLAEGVGLAQRALEGAAKEEGRIYGEDYVFLGFKTGGGTLILNMGQDFHSAFPKDLQGNDTAAMAVTKGIRSLRDMDYVISLASGSAIEMWIAYGQEKYRFPLAGGCTAVIAPDMFPFLQSRQLNGLIGGLAGAAEYEVLIHRKDAAVRGMKPQSVAHLILIFFILMGNAVYFLFRTAKTGRGDDPVNRLAR